MVVPCWSLLCNPGPHSMLVENRSFSLREQRTLCGALNLRQHEIASSYTCDWPTHKCSTHPTIITQKRPYVNNRLRPKFVLFPSFLTTFAHTTLNGVRGNGRDRFSTSVRPSSIWKMFAKTLNGIRGKIAKKHWPEPYLLAKVGSGTAENELY